MSAKPQSKKLLGRATPRLFTPPLRPLTKETSLGYSIIAFAKLIGLPLLPWQEWLVIHAFELMPDGSLRFRIVLVLVGRQNGKTLLSKVLALWRLYIFGSRLVLETAQDLTIATEIWEDARDIAKTDPELSEEYRKESLSNGNKWFAAGAGRCMVRASNGKASRSLSVDHLNMDELRELRGQSGWKAWSALSKTTGARMDAQIWGFSNAGDDESVVLNNLRSSAGVVLGDDGASLMGEPKDDSIFIAEWSGREGCELNDWDAIAQANPGLGYVRSIAAVRTDLGTDPADIFRTEVLCQKVDQLDGAVNLGAWQVCGDASGQLGGDPDNVVLCVDVALDSTHVALLGAAPTDHGRIALEVVGAWKTMNEFRKALPGLVAEIQPRAFAWFPDGPGAALGADIRKLAHAVATVDAADDDDEEETGADFELIKLTGRDVYEACQGFAEQVSSAWLVHRSDPLLDAHIAGAKRLQSGDGWKFGRRGAAHVNAAYAAAGAVHVLRNLPEPEEPQEPLMVVVS